MTILQSIIYFSYILVFTIGLHLGFILDMEEVQIWKYLTDSDLSF